MPVTLEVPATQAPLPPRPSHPRHRGDKHDHCQQSQHRRHVSLPRETRAPARTPSRSTIHARPGRHHRRKLGKRRNLPRGGGSCSRTPADRRRPRFNPSRRTSSTPSSTNVHTHRRSRPFRRAYSDGLTHSPIRAGTQHSGVTRSATRARPHFRPCPEGRRCRTFRLRDALGCRPEPKGRRHVIKAARPLFPMVRVPLNSSRQ